MLCQHQVLVLNSSYEAINICNARRAFVLLMKGIADSVEESSYWIHSASNDWRLPEVIRLRRFVHIPYRPVPFCRKNVFLRDTYICQYCGDKKTVEHLTIDHVLPQSRGGIDCWSNVITACRACNHQKGNRTPDEAGMPLLTKPKIPHTPSYLHLVRIVGANRSEWRKYLYYDEPDDSIETGIVSLEPAVV